MTHEDISLNTKHMLVNSFKKFMRIKPLSLSLITLMQMTIYCTAFTTLWDGKE